MISPVTSEAAPTLHPIPVAPSGETRCPAFVDYADGSGSLELLAVKIYPRDGRGAELRRLRVDAGLSLGDCADAVRISVVQLSALERNAGFTLDDAEWSAVMEWLRCAPGARGAV